MCEWGNYKKVKLAFPREFSGIQNVKVDKCLQKLVQLLNNKKVHTLSCCCGHNKGNGGILIHPDSFRITEFGYCEIILKDKL